MSKILVVDAMPMCREPLAEALTSRGHDVASAESGDQALCRLREVQPDVMILDLVVPGLDGLGVLRTIRSNVAWKSLPVIVVTDKADRQCIAQAVQLNVRAYILKSNFSFKALLSRVEACTRHDAASNHPLAPPPTASQSTSANPAVSSAPKTRAVSRTIT